MIPAVVRMYRMSGSRLRVRGVGTQIVTTCTLRRSVKSSVAPKRPSFTRAPIASLETLPIGLSPELRRVTLEESVSKPSTG